MTPDEEAADLATSIDAGIRSTQLGRIDTDDGPVFVGAVPAFGPAATPEGDKGPPYWHETSAEPIIGQPAPCLIIGADRADDLSEQLRQDLAACRARCLAVIAERANRACNPPVIIGVDLASGPDQTAVYRQPWVAIMPPDRRVAFADRVRLPRHLLTLDFSQAAPALPDE